MADQGNSGSSISGVSLKPPTGSAGAIRSPSINYSVQQSAISGVSMRAPQFQQSAQQPVMPKPVNDIDHARRDWLLAVQEWQRALSPRTGGVPRVSNLSTDDFLDHFYAPGRPVVIEDAIADWPALERWTPDYLIEKVGNAEIEYQSGRASIGRDFEVDKAKLVRRAPFTDFMADILNNEGNNSYLTANNSGANAAAIAPLHEDIRPIHAYTDGGPGMIWIGPAGTFTPLHFDLTNNMIVQVRGRKSIKLISPAETRLMYNNNAVFSDVHDIEDPERLALYPAAQEVTVHDVLLNPGDMLFAPIAWWHQVRSLDFSVTMTFTNFRWPNDGHQWYPQG